MNVAYNLVGNYAYDKVKQFASPYIRSAENYVVRRLTTDPPRQNMFRNPHPKRRRGLRSPYILVRQAPAPARPKRYGGQYRPRKRLRGCRQARLNRKLIDASRGRLVTAVNDNTVARSTWFTQSLVLSTRGAEFEKRDGDHIHVDGVYVKAKLYLDTAIAKNAAIYIGVMRDVTPNGAQVTMTDVLSDSPFAYNHAYVNDESVRIKRQYKWLIKPKKYFFRSREIAGAASGNDPLNATHVTKMIRMSWRNKRFGFIRVRYDGNAGTIADVQYNNIFLAYYVESSVDEAFSINAKCRTYFVN